MEKKNTMLLTIIAVATLLVAVVGATFAYFTAQNGASGSTTATVTTETIGAITVSNEDPALYLDLTAAQMQEGVTGSYWATKTKGAEPATNYASADKAVIAKLNVSGGGEETIYSCNFKITVDKTDVTLAYGDAAVVFALENNAEILGVTSGSEIDYTTLLNEYTVNFTRIGDTEEDLPLVSVSMRVSNTEVEQGFAGETLTTTFTSSDLECEVLEENPMRLTSPTISLNDNILNIIPTDERTEEYEIYVDGELKTTIPAIVETNNDDTNTLSGTWKFNNTLTLFPLISVGEEVSFTFQYKRINEKMMTALGTYMAEIEARIENGWEPTAEDEIAIQAEVERIIVDGIKNVQPEIATGTRVSADGSNSLAYNFTIASGEQFDNYVYDGNGDGNGSWDKILLGNDDGIFISATSRIITFTEEQNVSDEFYEWFIDNANQINTTYDLSNLNLENGIYEITVKAKGNGYETSEFSNKTEHTISILSGTWKFKDIISFDNFVESNIDFYGDADIVTIGTVTLYCKQLYISKDMDSTSLHSTAVSTVPDLSAEGLAPGDRLTLYSDAIGYAGWRGVQTLTFSTEQKVSAEFYEWFIANATKVS